MLLPDDRRRQLGAFLRTHREALSPGRAGLLQGRARRRTAGLRREEVAQLCGISTTWYTWIEQGRDISVSAQALSRLAEVLRLTAAERSYLFELACARDPSPPAAGGEEAPELLAALDGIAAPAYLLDRLWCVCGWNAAARHLFAPWLGSGEPCLLRFVFLDPASRDFICDWEDRARRLVAEFRADAAHRLGDAATRDLVAGLGRASADFTRFWNDHAVLAREGGRRRFNHPAEGALTFEQMTLVPAAHPGHKLVMLLPAGSPPPLP